MNYTQEAIAERAADPILSLPIDQYIRARHAAWEAAQGITHELLVEPAGYRLATYRHGVEIK